MKYVVMPGRAELGQVGLLLVFCVWFIAGMVMLEHLLSRKPNLLETSMFAVPLGVGYFIASFRYIPRLSRLRRLRSGEQVRFPLEKRQYN